MPIGPIRTGGSPPSRRACEAWDYYCRGWSYRRIAQRMGLSHSTVGVYIQMWFEYLGTHERQVAIARWRLRQNSAFAGVPAAKG